MLLLALYLSGTYCHRTGTGPPSCVTPRQPTIKAQKVLKSIILCLLRPCKILFRLRVVNIERRKSRRMDPLSDLLDGLIPTESSDWRITSRMLVDTGSRKKGFSRQVPKIDKVPKCTIWYFETEFFFFFFLLLLFLLSISPLWTAAWVTFNEAGFNRSCFVLQLVLGMFHVYLSRLLSSLSFSIHILISSLFFIHLTSFRSSPFRNARPRVYVVVHGRALVLFPNFTLRFDLNAMARSSWRRVSILRPSERMLSILPQDHGVLASLVSKGKFQSSSFSRWTSTIVERSMFFIPILSVSLFI